MVRRWSRPLRSAFALCVLLLVPAIGRAQTVVFSQLDFDLDGIVTLESDWGVADLTFVGSASMLYFNLTVNGSWQVQNLPVLSTGGTGVPQTLRFWFDLGNPVGTDVAMISHAFALTPAPLVSAPSGGVPASVGNDQVIVHNGGVDPSFSTTPAAAGASIGGPVAGIALHKHDNFPNQEAGLQECAPTAVSNSLQFLNTKHGLGMAAADITIAKMKTATKWGSKTVASAAGPGVDRVISPYPAGWPDPGVLSGVWIFPDPNGAAGQQNAWWQDKKAYMGANNLPITTRQILPADIGKLIREIDRGQDIEAEIGGHTVAVTGIADLGGGRYAVTVAHDTKQGVAGGTVEETAVWDSTTSTWEGALKNYGLNYFVVECPDNLPDDQARGLPGNGAGAGSHATFGSADLPALPAGFFDPGSDPFTGEVALVGANEPAASAAIRRYGDPILPSEPPPAIGTIDVEIVSLHLVSIQPLVVSSNGGSSFEQWTLDLTLSVPRSYDIPPLGSMWVTKTHANGGTFDAEFYVQPVFTFTRVNPPYDVRVLDTGGMLPSLHLSEVVVPWVHDADPSLHLPASPTEFRPGVEEVVPGTPSSQQLVPMWAESDSSGLVLELLLAGAVPAPSLSGSGRLAIALLLVVGGVAALRLRRPRCN